LTCIFPNFVSQLPVYSFILFFLPPQSSRNFKTQRTLESDRHFCTQCYEIQTRITLFPYFSYDPSRVV